MNKVVFCASKTVSKIYILYTQKYLIKIVYGRRKSDKNSESGHISVLLHLSLSKSRPSLCWLKLSSRIYSGRIRRNESLQRKDKQIGSEIFRDHKDYSIFDRKWYFWVFRNSLMTFVERFFRYISRLVTLGENKPITNQICQNGQNWLAGSKPGTNRPPLVSMSYDDNVWDLFECHLNSMCDRLNWILLTQICVDLSRNIYMSKR